MWILEQKFIVRAKQCEAKVSTFYFSFSIAGFVVSFNGCNLRNDFVYVLAKSAPNVTSPSVAKVGVSVYVE